MKKDKDLEQIWSREYELRNAGCFERELAAAACRWQKHSYAAACGVSDQVLWQMMKDNPQIDSVCLCLDNDEAGQKAAERLSQKLMIHGVQHEILIPNRKDWNEDRLAAGGNDPRKHACGDFSTQEETEGNECLALQL